MKQRSGGDASHRPGAPSFRGLGLKSRTWLAGIGITTPAQPASQDPFPVYARLKAAQPGVTLTLLYALIGAIEGRDWRDVARTERLSILLRLEERGWSGRGEGRRRCPERTLKRHSLS